MNEPGVQSLSRFLLIGLDGAEPTLVERWMAEGSLSNLARLRERGGYQPCASTVPHATFPAWSTCVTGVNPGKHGVIDFTRMRDGEYAIQFTNASERQHPAIWNVLSDKGLRSCVLGVPTTYPPDRINGIVVSGFDSPVCTGIDRSFVHPPEAYPLVKDWTFADFQETSIGPDWHSMALEKLLEGVERKESITLDLWNREAWDFFMVVFGETDTVSHHFWMFHDPNSPRHRAEHETAIRQVYQKLDATVGKMLDAAGDDVVVGVVSDHGFGGAGTGVVYLNNWLAQNGYLNFSARHDSLLKNVALSLTPESIRGMLFRKFRGLASKAESQSRFSGIDFAATTAWSEELNYFPSIRVNLKSREPLGQVSPEQYDSFCQELCEQLEQWDVIKKAWRRDELYSGPYVDRAPDIILELALEDGYSHSCLRSRGGESFRRFEAHEHLGGKEKGMNGNHRPNGVFFLSKPLESAPMSLLDIAPTVYDALGVAAPEMDGRSLLGGTIESAPASTSQRTTAAYTPEQEAEVESRLRNLGYFE